MKKIIILLLVMVLIPTARGNVPVIEGDSEVSYSLNETDRMTVEWSVVDTDAKEYAIFLDGEQVGYGNWSMPDTPGLSVKHVVSIELIVPPGQYTLLLKIWDYQGTEAKFETQVFVSTSTPEPPVSFVGFEFLFFGALVLPVVRKKLNR